MKRLIALVICASLAACATTPKPVPEPLVVVEEVKIPVSLPCVPENYNFNPPAYVDTNTALLAAVDAAERYQLLWAGRAQRIAREKENEAAISGCPRGSVK